MLCDMRLSAIEHLIEHVNQNQLQMQQEFLPFQVVLICLCIVGNQFRDELMGFDVDTISYIPVNSFLRF